MDRRIFTYRWRKLTPAGVLMTGAVCFKWGRGTWWDAAWAPLELFLTNDVNCCCSSTPPWARETGGGWDEEPDSFSRKSVTPRLNPPFLCLTNLRFGLASLDRRSWDLICPSKILCQGTSFGHLKTRPLIHPKWVLNILGYIKANSSVTWWMTGL